MGTYILRNSVTRGLSRATFEEYRETERHNDVPRAVTKDGNLLDYETLELRVHPPNIRIKIEEKGTLITLDSANRPGTLIEVVQCLTELGLQFTKARITSDGGWFVDEFCVIDNSAPLKDQKKIKTIEKVLNINFDADEAIIAEAGIDKGPCQVIEMLGQDRQGLLANIMTCFNEHHCEVWSASTWTSKDRATFVLGVNDISYPLTVTGNWLRLHSALFEIMGGSAVSALVELEAVVHPSLVHHERRLHRLMLKDELRGYEAEQVRHSCASSLTPDRNGDSGSLRTSRDGGASWWGGQGTWGNMSNSMHGAARAADLMRTLGQLGDPSDPWQPDVKVTYAPLRRYWFVRVLCQDRAKLFFDLVCTFVDLDFDIFHATLDAEPPAPGSASGAAAAAATAEEQAWHASVEFYVRPRLGGADYDDVKGRRLAEMLKAAITRGAPVGQEIRLFTRQSGLLRLDLTVLTRELFVSHMVITRATVYPSRAHRGFTEHRMWIADASTDDAPATEAAPPAGPVRSTPVGSSSRPDRMLLLTACARAGLQPRAKPPGSDARQHSGAVEFVVAEGSERWAVASGGSSSSNRTTAS
eukprot:jgi/Ulvmu1/7706/UM039_0012.1